MLCSLEYRTLPPIHRSDPIEERMWWGEKEQSPTGWEGVGISTQEEGFHPLKLEQPIWWIIHEGRLLAFMLVFLWFYFFFLTRSRREVERGSVEHSRGEVWTDVKLSSHYFPLQPQIWGGFQLNHVHPRCGTSAASAHKAWWTPSIHAVVLVVQEFCSSQGLNSFT